MTDKQPPLIYQYKGIYKQCVTFVNRNTQKSKRLYKQVVKAMKT